MSGDESEAAAVKELAVQRARAKRYVPHKAMVMTAEYGSRMRGAGRESQLFACDFDLVDVGRRCW